MCVCVFTGCFKVNIRKVYVLNDWHNKRLGTLLLLTLLARVALRVTLPHPNVNWMPAGGISESRRCSFWPFCLASIYMSGYGKQTPWRYQIFAIQQIKQAQRATCEASFIMSATDWNFRGTCLFLLKHYFLSASRNLVYMKKLMRKLFT